MVLEGITVGGKTLREHLEIINHREAIAYAEEIVPMQVSIAISKFLSPVASHVPPASYLIQEHRE